MIASKEKLEDMKWLEELLGMYARAVEKQHPLLHELEVEIAKTKEKIATHDYAEREQLRVLHFKEKGPHKCEIF